MDHLFICWNSETQTISDTRLISDQVTTMTANPDIGTAIVSIKDAQVFIAGFEVQGYPPAEVDKIRDALLLK